MSFHPRERSTSWQFQRVWGVRSTARRPCNDHGPGGDYLTGNRFINYTNVQPRCCAPEPNVIVRRSWQTMAVTERSTGRQTGRPAIEKRNDGLEPTQVVNWQTDRHTCDTCGQGEVPTPLRAREKRLLLPFPQQSPDYAAGDQRTRRSSKAKLVAVCPYHFIIILQLQYLWWFSQCSFFLDEVI